jgi:hypothetical protein
MLIPAFLFRILSVCCLKALDYPKLRCKRTKFCPPYELPRHHYDRT